MKKSFLLFFLTVTLLTSFGQYRKMPLDTNHYWNQTYVGLQDPNFFNCYYVLKFKKDTIINTKTYKFIATSYGYCIPNISSAYESALLREDTIQKRIVILDYPNEYILYNFNKNVGDTALLYVGGQNPMTTYTLTNKDSVLCQDGLYHKRFDFGLGNGALVIEGVGGENGLLYPNSFGESYEVLGCMAQIHPNKVIYPPLPMGLTCQLLDNLILKGNDKNIISIFPNPTSDILNIKTENTIPKSIEIKNIIGQTILSICNITKDITTINLKDITQGFYFININFSDKNISRHFIKN